MNDYRGFNISDLEIETLCTKWATNAAVTPMYPPRPSSEAVFDEDPLKVLGELSFNLIKPDSSDSVGTPIQEFFRGVNVFITGGSGFLGKVLTEKLVRMMPHLTHVYVLIRPKRGKTCEERFEQLMKDKVFSRMKAEVPDYRTKITALAGDIAEPDLGLCAEDRLLLQERVQVVFHCAANVRFLEPLRTVVTSNVLGSKRVLDLAKAMDNLKAYVHVSTAYSQCVHRVIEENVPSMPVDYKDVLNYINANTDSCIEKNIKKILQGWPNTYAFSKALCEQMLLEEAQGLPICIFRPSIVTSTYKEPVRGWLDNTNGPTAALLGVAVGVLHCLRVDYTNTVDVVPVDYVVNGMIATAWNTGTQRESGIIPVYNFTSSPQNVFVWKKFFEGKKCPDAWPSVHAIWYPSVIVTDNYYLDKVCHVVLHRIPGAILDKLAVMRGQKPRLVKIYKSMETLYEVTEYFKNGNWEFKNDNLVQLWTSLCEEDKKLFSFDVRDVDWVEYIYVSYLGGRYYLLNEKMDTLPAAQKKIKWLRAAHTGLKVLFGFVLLKLSVYAARLVPI